MGLSGRWLHPRIPPPLLLYFPRLIHVYVRKTLLAFLAADIVCVYHAPMCGVRLERHELQLRVQIAWRKSMIIYIFQAYSSSSESRTSKAPVIH
ncbi:hypothetical protein BDV41DRAFT_530145 [Aspergillus transmontanensis]|uniref:Uncharacterized protein n=1 Tax=Aspergillus transmontanensis TaxID=1034304 RepID=A0A5N6W8S5_9EURO|nr:hypothetical protein BDV41DRAFT_530145 [Aspergillus transmontanensis]